MKLHTYTVGEREPLFLIAGPCVVESEAIVMRIASEMKAMTTRLGIPYVFKASFDKANRTSSSSYRGPGLEEGLRVLEKVKRELELPVLTDVHEDTPIDEVASVVDVLQTPAFLVRQTNFMTRVARAGLPMNVKKGQFQAPSDMVHVVQKCRDAGNEQVMVCERGVSFGYNTLISDMRGLAIMRETGCPVVFDATHSVQQPGGQGASSGGQSALVPVLARGRGGGHRGHLHGDAPGSGERALGRAEYVAPRAHGGPAGDAGGAGSGGEVHSVPGGVSVALASTLPPELLGLAAGVRLLVLDADGVLTDGRLYYGESGEVLKAFHARDGLGLRLLRNEGVQLAVISGRAAPALARRLADLRVHHVLLGRDDKRAALEECLAAAGVSARETAFVGDDVLDLVGMRHVGLSVAVADAHALVRREAAWVTRLPGGHGAVREVADGLLMARGRLDEAIDELLSQHVGRGENLQ